MLETSLMRLVQIEATRLGARLFRNNCGMLEDKFGNKIKYGLCVGSSDLIGWDRHGRFLAIEIKAPGSRTNPARLKKQNDFITAVNVAGGIAFFASSIEEVRANLI